MSARKYNTLGNVLYIIDRKGNLYLERGKIKRSTIEYHYELSLNTGSYWHTDNNKYATRSEAMNKVKELVI